MWLPFREREKEKEPCCGHLKPKENTEGGGRERRDKKE